MIGDIQAWLKGLPLFTRYWFGLCVLFPLAGRFGLIPYSWVVLVWEPLWHDFHLWRPVTAAFTYPTSFHYLVLLYFLYTYSVRLETGIFAGRPADYGFMLFFSWACAVVAALTLRFSVLMDLMVMSIVYVWCMLNKDVIVQFWFGTQFKAMYLPWVLFAFNLIIKGGGTSELIGIVVGHLYFFLTFKYPQDFGGPSLLSTPSIFYRWFPSTNAGGTSGIYGRAPTVNEPRPQRHNWGGGVRLGGD